MNFWINITNSPVNLFLWFLNQIKSIFRGSVYLAHNGLFPLRNVIFNMLEKQE